jgi:enoyl-CoA hydratase/carnithine racemase
VSLREKHKQFLDLVANHGEGSIDLSYDFSKKIATISITNESKRNAISGRMMNQLADLLEDLIGDSDKRRKVMESSIIGLLMRSSGKSFCAGADLTLVKDIGRYVSYRKLYVVSLHIFTLKYYVMKKGMRVDIFYH